MYLSAGDNMHFLGIPVLIILRTALCKMAPHSGGSTPPKQFIGIRVLGSVMDFLQLVDRSHDSQVACGALDNGSQVSAVSVTSPPLCYVRVVVGGRSS